MKPIIWSILFSLILSGCDSTPAIKREVISTPTAPVAIGPYSQAIKVGQTLYLAGQIGLDPETGQLAEGGIKAQTQRAMQNLKAVLEAAGFGLEDVVQVQVFLSDLNDYTAMNSVYAEYFDNHPPARAVVEAARIPRDAAVEIMMVARQP